MYGFLPKMENRAVDVWITEEFDEVLEMMLLETWVLFARRAIFPRQKSKQ